MKCIDVVVLVALRLVLMLIFLVSKSVSCGLEFTLAYISITFTSIMLSHRIRSSYVYLSLVTLLDNNYTTCTLQTIGDGNIIGQI